MLETTINAEEVKEQLRRLNDYPTTSERHIRPAMGETVQLIASAWRMVTPYQSGAYAGGIVGRVESVAGTRAVGLIETNVGAQGFPYPARLESSRRYHYASSSMQTKGQVKRAATGIFPAIIARFVRAVEAILNDLAVKA